MLEEAPNDARHADVVREPFDAGTQATDTAHDEIDLRPRLPRRVECLNNLGIDNRIHLGNDAPRTSGTRVRGLARNHF